MTNELLKPPFLTPPYFFAVTQEVFSKGPIELDGETVSPNDFLPKQGRPKDTGYDVRCAELAGLTIQPGHYFKMKLGFRALCPEGWWLRLAPRSGTFAKLNVHALYGTIDELYENEFCFAGQYIPDSARTISGGAEFHIPYGARIGQLIPMPRYEMPVVGTTNEELTEKFKERDGVRGTSGFGSSGRA